MARSLAPYGVIKVQKTRLPLIKIETTAICHVIVSHECQTSYIILPYRRSLKIDNFSRRALKIQIPNLSVIVGCEAGLNTCPTTSTQQTASKTTSVQHEITRITFDVASTPQESTFSNYWNTPLSTFCFTVGAAKLSDKEKLKT